MTTPYNTGKVRIGLFYEEKRRQQLSWNETQIQEALLRWQQRADNDSRFGGWMHPKADEYMTKRTEARKFVRRFIAMLLSPKAPRVTR